MTQLAEYRCKDGFFSNSYMFKSIDKLSPIVQLKGTCYGLKLSIIALAILEMPPTTIATERSFSTQGFIHSFKPNRLTTERAAKLTFISHNLKTLNKKYIKSNKHQKQTTSNIDIQNYFTLGLENSTNSENRDTINFEQENTINVENQNNIFDETTYSEFKNLVASSEDEFNDFSDSSETNNKNITSSKFSKLKSYITCLHQKGNYQNQY